MIIMEKNIITTKDHIFVILKRHLVVVLAALLVVVSGTAYYFYQKLQELNGGNKLNAQAEVKDLVVKVGRLIILPQGEDPTVATVVDPERLKDQAFFANTRKGDKVLIYTTAKKAILYNPESNKIVEVAPVNIGNPASNASAPAPVPAPAPETTPKKR